MPAEGFKTITVSEEVYGKLDVFAGKTHRSIPKAVEFLLEKADASLKRSEKKTLEIQNNG